MTFLCMIALENKTAAHTFPLSLPSFHNEKRPSLSRNIVEIQIFCYHGNVTSRFSLLFVAN